jgi:hypothetical protein
MNHPSPTELLEFIDDRLGKERAGEITAHLAGCALCRRKVELERSTRKIVRSEPLVKAPAGLSISIMVNLVTSPGDSWVLQLLGKLGSFMAMIVVLAVVGFAIVQVSSVNGESDKTSSSITQIVAPLSLLYAKGAQTFTLQMSKFTQAIETKSAARMWQTVFILILTIGVLAAADKVFGKRFMKLRP